MLYIFKEKKENNKKKGEGRGGNDAKVNLEITS